MKKLWISLMMLSLCVGISCATSIINIRAQDYESVACRFVLDLTVDADFTVIPKANGFQIDIENFDGKDANRKINSSIIKEVRILPSGVLLNTIGNLRYEMMRYDDTKQAVIDFFIQAKTRSQHLAIANFYSDRGKYRQADELYAQLDRQYPQDDEILYHWGVMLKRSGRPQQTQSPKPAATEPDKTPQPRQSSQPEAELGRRYVPQLPPEEPSETYFIDLSGDDSIHLDSLFQSDSLVTLVQLPPVKLERISFLEVVSEIASRYFLLTLLFFVSALVIIYILLFGGKKKKNSYKEEPGFEIRALRRMVARLLADGWTHKEIARELKITSNEIAKIANLPQKSYAEDLSAEDSDEDFEEGNLDEMENLDISEDAEPAADSEAPVLDGSFTDFMDYEKQDYSPRPGIEEYDSDFLSPKIDIDSESSDDED